MPGYLNVKHGSKSSCVLAPGFGKLTEPKGKTKCLSCKLITLSIFRLSGELCCISSAAFYIHGLLILGRSLPKAKAEELAASLVNSRPCAPSLAFLGHLTAAGVIDIREPGVSRAERAMPRALVLEQVHESSTGSKHLPAPAATRSPHR